MQTLLKADLKETLSSDVFTFGFYVYCPFLAAEVCLLTTLFS